RYEERSSTSPSAENGVPVVNETPSAACIMRTTPYRGVVVGLGTRGAEVDDVPRAVAVLVRIRGQPGGEGHPEDDREYRQVDAEPSDGEERVPGRQGQMGPAGVRRRRESDAHQARPQQWPDHVPPQPWEWRSGCGALPRADQHGADQHGADQHRADIDV